MIDSVEKVSEMKEDKESQAILIARNIVFGSKWILVPFYVGLVVAQVLYAVKYVMEVFHSCLSFYEFSETQMMLAMLSLIDMVMIANLVRTIVAGSYHAFIDKNGPINEHISSGYLKVKMGMSLIGISSIHLLQAFINTSELTNREVIVKGGIHLLFLVSTIGLAFIEYMHEKSKEIQKEGHK